jgi:hypothetical protein
MGCSLRCLAVFQKLSLWPPQFRRAASWPDAVAGGQSYSQGLIYVASKSAKVAARLSGVYKLA